MFRELPSNGRKLSNEVVEEEKSTQIERKNIASAAVEGSKKSTFVLFALADEK